MRFDPCDPLGPPGPGARFVLYVEGPSDCDILRSWARLLSPRLSKIVAQSAVILGGRRPARAVEHFGRIRDQSEDARGVCVLDRDGHGKVGGSGEAQDGLEFFTWSRRHIESYLLVPTAMRRCLGAAAADPRVAELLLDLPAPAADERVEDLDAKRLLAERAQLARELGLYLSPARIARCMSRRDLHDDVLHLLDRLGEAAQAHPIGVRD